MSSSSTSSMLNMSLSFSSLSLIANLGLFSPNILKVSLFIVVGDIFYFNDLGILSTAGSNDGSLTKPEIILNALLKISVLVATGGSLTSSSLSSTSMPSNALALNLS